LSLLAVSKEGRDFCYISDRIQRRLYVLIFSIRRVEKGVLACGMATMGISSELTEERMRGEGRGLTN
jgi:hypothetical protein